MTCRPRPLSPFPVPRPPGLPLLGLATALLVLLIGLAAVPPTRAYADPAPADGVWPLQPRPEVVRGFEPPTTRWGSGHRGVDLRGTVGQPVRAAEPGTVVFAGRLAGRGVVVVDHGGTRTTYEPVAPGVRLGDVVGAGTVLGRLALAGSHCFPVACLHWGLIAGSGAGDRYLDPLTLVGGSPVRLLPLAGAAVVGTPLFPWPSLRGPVGPGPVPLGPHPAGSEPAGSAPGAAGDRPVPEPAVRPAAPAGRAALFRG